jgi:hypothetical protein
MELYRIVKKGQLPKKMNDKIITYLDTLIKNKK